MIDNSIIVIGGGSCSEGRGFESRHLFLDEHFFTYICWIKEAGVDPLNKS